MNHYCGSEFDEDHVVCTALFLQGQVLMWYSDNVDGMDHQKEVWSFKTLITGLYDRFIHDVTVKLATDQFGSMLYEPTEGVAAFYHKLTRYATRMVRPPDRYTFK